MSRRAGFSLIETLVSLLILGIGIAGMSGAITLSYRTSKDSEEATRAALLASARLELIRADGFLIEGESEGEFGEGLEGYSWRETIEETATEGLYEVTAAIFATSTGGREKRGEKGDGSRKGGESQGGEPQKDNEKKLLHEARTLLYDMPYLSTGTEEGGNDDPRARRRTEEP